MSEETKPEGTEFGKQCDEVAERAAKELGCAVVLIALQTEEQGGKVCASHGGLAGSAHPLAAVVDSPARLLGALAMSAAMGEALLPTPGKPLTVQYAPGFADNLNLPPGELADLKNYIERAVASGEIFEQAIPLSAEEAEELEGFEEEHLRARGSSSTPQ
jgi:hypothetical protein